MAVDDKKLVIDVSAWLSNVVTSVLIIFMNKLIMSVYKFVFATTICGLHFVSCSLAIWAAQGLGLTTHVAIPFKDALIFSLVGSVSIAAANLSLLLNTVGFYQIAKLMLVPFVCSVEIFHLRRQFPAPALASILVVMAGVAIVTVTDVGVNPTGVLMAALFVVASGTQQILVGTFQTKFKLSSHQLLANTAPIQGMLLLVAGPLVDRLVTERWVTSWEINVPGVEMLLLSCVTSVAVNLSQFLCLGRFSATSFQVLGHTKTVLVLLGGWALFKEPINVKQLGGMVLAVVGMLMYGMFQGGASPAKPTKPMPLTSGAGSLQDHLTQGSSSGPTLMSQATRAPASSKSQLELLSNGTANGNGSEQHTLLQPKGSGWKARLGEEGGGDRRQDV
ncbi:MAG: hypothetical protein WDW38_002233 [Sanguina aurantia]